MPLCATASDTWPQGPPVETTPSEIIPFEALPRIAERKRMERHADAIVEGPLLEVADAIEPESNIIRFFGNQRENNEADASWGWTKPTGTLSEQNWRSSVPTEVETFTARNGLSQYLQSLLGWARRVSGDAHALLSHDPEIAGRTVIVITAPPPPDVQEAVDQHFAFAREVVESVPVDKQGFFILSLDGPSC